MRRKQPPRCLTMSKSTAFTSAASTAGAAAVAASALLRTGCRPRRSGRARGRCSAVAAAPLRPPLRAGAAGAAVKGAGRRAAEGAAGASISAVRALCGAAEAMGGLLAVCGTGRWAESTCSPSAQSFVEAAVHRSAIGSKCVAPAGDQRMPCLSRLLAMPSKHRLLRRPFPLLPRW